MKLLYTKRSPYARKVRIVALEKGIALDLIDEDLANKSEQLKKANPIAKIPTLILDNGQTVYDSKVIVYFLEQLKAQPAVYPTGDKKIDALKWEAFADDLVTVAINAYMEKIRHPQDFNASFVHAQENAIYQAFQYIEQHLDQLKDFHIGTINVACAIGYIQFRLPHISLSAPLSQWFKTISQRDSLVKTIPTA
jgi:glutathione S-transferase